LATSAVGKDISPRGISFFHELPLPLFLYNMPALTKVHIETETIRWALDQPRIAGLKDSSGDLTYFKNAAALLKQRPDWSLFIGPEEKLFDALQAGEISTAVVGAVDLSRESCHEQAVAATMDAALSAADAAVVLVLKPLAAAIAAGDSVMATIELSTERRSTPIATSRLLGHAHAASGLLEVAAHVVALQRGCRFDSAANRMMPLERNGLPTAVDVAIAPSLAREFVQSVRLHKVEPMPQTRDAGAVRAELEPGETMQFALRRPPIVLPPLLPRVLPRPPMFVPMNALEEVAEEIIASAVLIENFDPSA